jgi:hypothetical protein
VGTEHRPALRQLDFDELLGERVVWSGSPTALDTPQILKAAAWTWAALSLTSTCFAIVVATTLQHSPTALILLGAWSASCALLCLRLPSIWFAGVRYVVTERHVVYQRGPFRRTIERGSISFARIMWSKHHAGTGTIELVRAVPTGALRRRLLLTLQGVTAPDRVWDIIRGLDTIADPSVGTRALGQRLEPDERVLWSARPHPTRLSYLPQGERGWFGLGLALTLFSAAVVMAARLVDTVHRLAEAGLTSTPFSFAALLAGVSTTFALLVSVAAYFLHSSVLLPVRQLRDTSYVVTDRRVLIQREREELHLDRSHVVAALPVPALKGAHDIFLVLDGPRARALAMSGAFGEAERGPELRPVLESVDDVDGVRRALFNASHRRRDVSLPPAA